MSIDDYSPVKKDVVALGETSPGGVMASATEAEMIMFESKVEATDSEAQENPWALMTVGDNERLERVRTVVTACQKKLVDFSDPEGVWKDLQLSMLEEGEKEVFSMQCVAFETMPQHGCPVDLTWGKGMLILSEVAGTKKQRLHFVMQESMLKFEGMEENSAAMSKSMLSSVGVFSAKSAYKATRGLRYLSTPLDVDTHILGISTEIADVATLSSRFGGGGGWNWSCCSWLRCCKCWKCPKCPKIKCCARKKQYNSQNDSEVWQGSLAHRPRFTNDLSQKQRENLDASYTYSGRENKGKETRDLSVDQMHTLKILYQLPAQKPKLCVAWVSPSQNIQSCLRFAHTIRITATVVDQGPSVESNAWGPNWLQAFKDRFLFPTTSSVNASGAGMSVAVAKSLSCRQKIMICTIVVVVVGILIIYLATREQ